MSEQTSHFWENGIKKRYLRLLYCAKETQFILSLSGGFITSKGLRQPRGCVNILLGQFFSKNCMKMKKIMVCIPEIRH